MDTMYVVTDIVVFKIIHWKLCVLIVQRDTVPYKWERCLPWWFVKSYETVEKAAYRIIKKETWLSQIYLEQLHVFSEIDRDPRWRAIWIWFIGILNINQVIVPWLEQKEALFVDINKLPQLVFNHWEVVALAYQKVIQGIEDWLLITYFLPKYFTLSELQHIYEIILHRRYDKRNFRRMIEKNSHIKITTYKQNNVLHRPASLYTFIK
jgi:8-oxo-dGTP diphosphatase